MPAPRPSIDELYAVLVRTDVATVVVEGEDDIIFYRKLDKMLSDIGISTLSAGEKDSVLKLWERLRNGGARVPVLFIVDQDTWIYEGVPEYYRQSGLVLTTGYSVENDLYEDGGLEKLLDEAELEVLQKELNKFVRWYALQIHRHLADKSYPFKVHPQKVLDEPEFFDLSTKLRQNETFPQELYESIRRDYTTKLRGKALIALALRQLARDGRDIKYGARQLMGFGSAAMGPNLTRITGQLRAAHDEYSGKVKT